MKIMCKLFGHDFVRIHMSSIYNKEYWKCYRCDACAESEWNDRTNSRENRMIWASKIKGAEK